MIRKVVRRALNLGLALFLAALAGPSARAQGMFYQEVEKDGRIYVFNIAKEHAAWSKSGELGKAITRLGYGSNDETVIFDSEAAISLYNFKHGKPAEAFAEPAKPKMEVSWKDGKTTIATDKAQLSMSTRIQARFTQESPDDSVKLFPGAGGGDGRGSFRIRRAKFKLEGWVYSRDLTYEFQLNFMDAGSAQPTRMVEDAWINWDISKKKLFQVKLGQFKVPFGRQELTSSGSQQFVDRTDVSNRYARGRETGIQVWGSFLGNKAEWRAGAFNGNSRSQTANDNGKFQYNARIQFHPSGDPKFSESDFDSKDKLLWAIAGNFELNDKSGATTSTDNKDTIWGGDFIAKYKGFSVQGEYFDKKAEPETGAEFKDKGWYVQVGYLLGAKRNWELAFRNGSIDPSDLKTGDDRKEIGGALSYYYNKHNLKVQADFRQLEDEAANSGQGVKNKEFRLQTQFVF